MKKNMEKDAKKTTKKNEKVSKEVKAAMEKQNLDEKPEVIHGFNIAGFYDFLCGIGYNMVEGEKVYELVDRIVRYGFERKMVFKDEFCEWLADMLPGVGLLDAAAYMSRGRLSDEVNKALEDEEAA